MSSPLRFSDHTAFHHQVLRVTLAGAALGLIFYVLGMLVPINGKAAQAIILALGTAAFGLAATPPLRRTILPAVLLALGVGLLGALARQALASSTPHYPWFGMGVYGLTIGIIAGRDIGGYRRYILPLATGLAVVLATWVDGTFRAQIHLSGYVPSFMAEPIHGALYGFMISVALVVRQVIWHQDPVTKAFEEIRPRLSGEMLELADQSVTLYVKIQKVLRDRREKGEQVEPAMKNAVESLVLRIFDMGRQWQEVERGASQTSAEELVERISTLEQKIESSSDEVASKQYRLACDALKTQLKYLKDISRNRERVTARAHNYLATLERLHLALWNHRGADAAKLSDEVQPILDEIEDIGCEMDFAAEAIDEVSEVSAPAEEEKEEDVPRASSEDAQAAGLDASAATESEPKGLDASAATESEPKALTEGDEADSTTGQDEDDPNTDADPEAELSARAFD